MADKSHGSCTGSEMVYKVEARDTSARPREANGLLLDNRWRAVEFARGYPGVENKTFSAEAQRAGFLSYDAALTLAHWFLANAGYCVEARLVKIRFSHSYTTEEIGVSPAMSSFHAERDARFIDRAEIAQTVDAVATPSE